MSRFKHYLRQGFNNLTRTPVYMATIILTMGLTLGALASAFGLSYLLIFKPLPYPEQEQLYVSDHARIKDQRVIGKGFQSYPALIETYKQEDLFSQAALIQNVRKRVDNLPLALAVKSAAFNVSYITPEYFSIFGSSFTSGRGFNAEEGLNTNIAVAVISDKFWREHFAGSSDILQKSLLINEVSFRIVGVLNSTFVEPKFDKERQNSSIWLPWDYNIHSKEFRQDWTNFLPFNHLVSRLKPGEVANISDTRVKERLMRRFREETKGNEYWSQMQLTHHMVSLEQAIVGDSKTTSLFIFFGLLGITLLAGSNIINLFVSRISQSQKQLSIKVALGATPRQLFLTIFAEALVLMTLAAVTAFATFYAGVIFTKQYGTAVFPRLAELGMQLYSALFIGIISLLAAVIFTAFAVRSLNYKGLISSIQSSGKGGALQVSQKTRNFMVISQVACAGVLLCASIEIANRALDNMNRSLGFDVQNTAFLRVESKADDIGSGETTALIQQIKTNLTNLRNIEVVANSNSTPLTAYLRRSTVLLNSDQQVRSYVIYADENYFSATSISLINGQVFNRQDIANKSNVAVLSESMALALFGDIDVAGKTMLYGSRRTVFTVAGVVRDTAHPSLDHDTKVLYLPFPRPAMTFILKGSIKEQSDVDKINQALLLVDPRLSTGTIRHLTTVHESMISRDMLLFVISMALTSVALILTAIGIYGSVNYSIRLMRYELGVRMALGASPIKIARLILTVNTRSFVQGLLLSLLAGGVIYSYLVFFADMGSPVQLTSVIVTFLTITLVTILSNLVPVTEQFRQMPIRYLGR